MKSRLIVAAVIQDGNKILLGQKPTGKGPYPDTWHIPGGGVELEKEYSFLSMNDFFADILYESQKKGFIKTTQKRRGRH